MLPVAPDSCNISRSYLRTDMNKAIYSIYLCSIRYRSQLVLAVMQSALPSVPALLQKKNGNKFACRAHCVQNTFLNFFSLPAERKVYAPNNAN